MAPIVDLLVRLALAKAFFAPGMLPGGDIGDFHATWPMIAAQVMGPVLLAAGSKGKRFALPHARILIHQPYGGAAGQATDIELQAKEILRMRDLLNQMLAHDTGNPIEKIAKDTDRDFIMSADEARDYGLIDEVIVSRELAQVPQVAGVS